MSFLTDDRVLWFFTRGTGTVVLVLLTASTVLGVLATTRTSSVWWPRFVNQALHRNIALIGLTLVVAHALTAIVDGYVDLTPADLIVPFRAGYRGLWSSMGILAFDLLLLAAATGLARHRFGLRRWRVVHLGTYLAWPLAVAHGLGMGSDRGTAWSIALTAVCVGSVAGAVSLRLAGLVEERRRPDGLTPPPRRPVDPAGSAPSSGSIRTTSGRRAR